MKGMTMAKKPDERQLEALKKAQKFEQTGSAFLIRIMRKNVLIKGGLK